MKFCVIGLGRFGYEVAAALADNGMEVLGVDADESIIASIRDQVTQAVCMRVTDEASLRSIGVDEMETVIVAMGENFAQSILITALLKKRLSIPHVITRAINEIHKEILKLIGSDEVILPEKAIGRRLADTLSSPFTDHVRLSENFSISQLAAPKKFLNKSIKTLRIFDSYNVYCIGIRKKGEEEIQLATPDYIIQEGDKLLFAGQRNDLGTLTKL